MRNATKRRRAAGAGAPPAAADEQWTSSSSSGEPQPPFTREFPPFRWWNVRMLLWCERMWGRISGRERRQREFARMSAAYGRAIWAGVIADAWARADQVQNHHCGRQCQCPAAEQIRQLEREHLGGGA